MVLANAVAGIKELVNGITTRSHGAPRYLAAVTAATTSYQVIYFIARGFSIDSPIEINGRPLAPDITLEKQQLLARMYVNKVIYDKIDIYAYFGTYLIMDRNMTVDAIEQYRGSVRLYTGNSLYEVVKRIAKSLFEA